MKMEKSTKERPPLPEGPWLDEPNRKEFTHSGLNCLILRGPVGSLCGYVAVGKDHPFHGVWYGGCTKGCNPKPEVLREILGHPVPKSMQEWNEKHPRCEEFSHSPESILDVHGGLTYSGACSGEICHVPKPGEEDDVWWFGFDTAHCDDLVPGLLEIGGRKSEYMADNVYRDISYVESETRKLAEQLWAIKEIPR